MKHFCPLPWNSLEIDAMGFYKPCCLSEIITDKGIQLSVRNSSIDDARNSKYMTNLREEFIQGNRPKHCSKCWAVEDSGQLSKRNHAIIKFQSKPDNLTNKPEQLTFLDLKSGNICNIKCRICGGPSSSRWVAENKDIFKEYELAATLHNNGQWPRTSDNIWEQLHEQLEFIKYFEISGGEPFLIQEQFDLMELAVKKGYSKNISIHYNTNGTIYPEKALTEIWPYFKNVEIAFSIDDIFKRFEYQRYPANFNEVDKNLNKINILKGINNNHIWLQTQICCTVNKQNILYLPLITRYILSKRINFWHYNMLHNPVEFSVMSFNPDLKNKIRQQVIKQTNLYGLDINLIEPVLNFMMTEFKDLDKEFLHRISIHDKYRGQKFHNVFPELAELIDE